MMLKKLHLSFYGRIVDFQMYRSPVAAVRAESRSASFPITASQKPFVTVAIRAGENQEFRTTGKEREVKGELRIADFRPASSTRMIRLHGGEESTAGRAARRLSKPPDFQPEITLQIS